MGNEMEEYGERLKKTHVAFVTETWRLSFARDVSTAATFLFLWSIGHYADSAALEWCGIALGFLILVGRLSAFLKGNVDKRMTPDQARAWLDCHFPPTDRKGEG